MLAKTRAQQEVEEEERGHATHAREDKSRLVLLVLGESILGVHAQPPLKRRLLTPRPVRVPLVH